MKLVPAPSESELREYFDTRKNFVGDDRGNPGFLELPKVKLAYLVASNVEAYEKGATKPTDQEIVDYYVKHKREFQIFDIPDFPDSKLPDSNLPDLKGADPHAPADALVPANTAAEQPVDVNPAPGNPPTGEKPAVEKPAVEKPAVEKPAVEKPAVEKPADKPLPEKKDPEKKDDEKPASDDPSKSDPKCGDDPVTKPAATEGDDAKPADEKVNLPKPAAEKGSETPPAPALPTSEADDAHSKLAPPSFSPMNFGPMAPPKFRELDDDLKRDISEKVLLEKASARMSDAADAALAFMMDLNQKYAFAEKADQDKIVSTFADACRQYAEEKGLEYHETREMTRQELELSLNEKIGTASESVSERSSRRNPPRVVDLVFDMVGRNYRISLYSPQRADLPNAKYAYWKTADIASRVPELTNDVTHRLVVDSWEFEKARVLAETRARELAELVKKSPTDIPGALSGQTVNGKPESPAVTVHEAPKFSWLRVSSSVPTMMSFGRPEESSISGIEGAGSDFMKLIFEQLGDGDVGVGLNRAKTAFYVVRVHDRDGSSSNDGGVALQELQQQFLNERFTNPRGFPTPYDYLSSEVQQFVFEHWKQNFSKRFAISFEGPLQESDEE